ncbi:MAG: hypothetical protein ACP5IX_02860 [Patescibacteria group bacterium]
MNQDQLLTKSDLAEFAEETLLPAVERIIDDRVPKIIEERVPKIIDERVPKIVDARIDAKVPPMLNKVKLELMDHFDDKIADLRGDIVLLLRREDKRLQFLINKLREKNILEDKDVKELEEMKVFVRQI